MVDTADHPPFELELPLTAAALSGARREFEAWLAACGVRPSVVEDVVTAASELCTNAIQAARSKVTLSSRVEGETLVFEVRDDGPGIDVAVPEEEPDPLASSGRGLYVARQLVDVMWVATDPDTGGTVARCGRRLD